MPTLHTRITASNEAKEAFEIVKKSSHEFFKGASEGWKKEIERSKEYQREVEKAAKKVGGKKPDDLAGAFNVAAAAANAFNMGMLSMFGVSGVAGTAAAIAGFAIAATKEFASIEEGESYLLATGKVKREEIEKYRHEWEKWGPVVGKDLKNLQSDFYQLLTTNDKLTASFPQMEKFSALQGSSFAGVLALANQAMVAGVKPSEMPAYLDKAAASLDGLGDAGTLSAAKVSREFNSLGINGVRVQNEINATIGAMAGMEGGAEGAAQGMINVIKQIAEGKGDSQMEGMVKGLRKGTLTLREFFNIMMDKTNPSFANFQKILEKDPITRNWILNWSDARAQFDIFMKSTDKIDDNPLFKDRTAIALNRFTDAIRGLLRATGEALPASKTAHALADGIDKMTDANKRYNDSESNVSNKLKSNPIGRLILEGADRLFSKHPANRWQRDFSGRPPAPSYVPPSAYTRPKLPLPGPWRAAPGDPTRMAEGGFGPGLAMTGERGPELIMGSDGIKRIDRNATISTLGSDDMVVPLGSSTGLPREHTPGFNPGTARYGPDPSGAYYTHATTFGGHPGDPERGIPRVIDPDDKFGSNQARVKEEHQGISLPGTPFGGTETQGPELNKLYQVQLPDGSWTLQRVTDTGPGKKGHGGLDMSVGALAREGIRHKTFDSDVRYRQYKGGALPSSMKAGRNLVTAGGYLDTSSGEGSLPYGSPEYDIPGRYRQEPAQAFKPMPKQRVEVESPPRHEIERAARHQYRATGGPARRQHQSSNAGRLGYA